MPTNLFVTCDTIYTIRCSQDISKVLVLRVKDLIEDLGFNCTIIWLLGWIMCSLLLTFCYICCLLSIDIVLSIFWTRILYRLLKLLLLLLAYGYFVIIINIFFGHQLVLATNC